jgi:hypothetical protein
MLQYNATLTENYLIPKTHQAPKSDTENGRVNSTCDFLLFVVILL